MGAKDAQHIHEVNYRPAVAQVEDAHTCMKSTANQRPYKGEVLDKTRADMSARIKGNDSLTQSCTARAGQLTV